MATINISLPDPLYKEVKKLVARGGYTSISELIRDALRKKLDGSKITVNGFTEEIEKEVLWSEAGPDVSDVWKSEKDIRNYFKNLRAKRAKQKKEVLT
ncbi:MAG: hypothetical protein A3A58_01315 [Candidatus Blackburnbacteria bacterium RIFCSPLOWO2_01_FULL_41_27]|uniref:Ribbon-helix-helix protein CopG domain-containing protein n=2 Tax=Candidatus Blackburniibacteriota TaxID=1817898 RepID=A0A1G1V9F2_9BACT|nr:MAG: hypothetical protein A3F61_03295 [Candidatus Blackburnbacteria bacterium RIFCSPHIGHO2_12_FULL_41_13b]OGY13367.1 MAG: hypothetical protein A3A58_01315 [Candidatus Blackburnbacteria bacterium RIFCSPLOWO2_01_FULL_41_27]